MSTLKTLFVDTTPADEIRQAALSRGLESVSRGIGWIAILLPFICFAAALWPNLPPDGMRNSLSHFYYTPFSGDLFVGCMFFIGVLLLFFFQTRGNPVEGWSDVKWYDVALLRVAGILALAVAFFPTAGPGGAFGDVETHRVMLQGWSDLDGCTIYGLSETCDAEYRTKLSYGYVPDYTLGWLGLSFIPTLGDVPIHSAAAAVLFLILAYFSGIVFVRMQRDSSRKEKGSTTGFGDQKNRRNRWYRLLGATIILCVVGLVVQYIVINAGRTPDQGESWWDARDYTFYVEWLAMSAFGFAWLIKAGVVGWLNDTA